MTTLTPEIPKRGMPVTIITGFLGSGKTIAFLLPIVEKMLIEGPPDDSSIFLK